MYYCIVDQRDPEGRVALESRQDLDLTKGFGQKAGNIKRTYQQDEIALASAQLEQIKRGTVGIDVHLGQPLSDI